MNNNKTTTDELKELYASLNRDDMNLQVQIRTLSDRMAVSASQLQETMNQYRDYVSDDIKAIYDTLKDITDDFTSTVLSEEDMKKLQDCLPEIQNIQKGLTTEAGEIQKKLKQLTEMQGS